MLILHLQLQQASLNLCQADVATPACFQIHHLEIKMYILFIEEV